MGLLTRRKKKAASPHEQRVDFGGEANQGQKPHTANRRPVITEQMIAEAREIEAQYRHDVYEWIMDYYKTKLGLVEMRGNGQPRRMLSYVSDVIGDDVGAHPSVIDEMLSGREAVKLNRIAASYDGNPAVFDGQLGNLDWLRTSVFVAEERNALRDLTISGVLDQLRISTHRWKDGDGDVLTHSVYVISELGGANVSDRKKREISNVYRRLVCSIDEGDTDYDVRADYAQYLLEHVGFAQDGPEDEYVTRIAHALRTIMSGDETSLQNLESISRLANLMEQSSFDLMEQTRDTSDYAQVQNVIKSLYKTAHERRDKSLAHRVSYLATAIGETDLTDGEALTSKRSKSGTKSRKANSQQGPPQFKPSSRHSKKTEKPAPTNADAKSTDTRSENQHKEPAESNDFGSDGGSSISSDTATKPNWVNDSTDIKVTFVNKNGEEIKDPNSLSKPAMVNRPVIRIGRAGAPVVLASIFATAVASPAAAATSSPDIPGTRPTSGTSQAGRAHNLSDEIPTSGPATAQPKTQETAKNTVGQTPDNTKPETPSPSTPASETSQPVAEAPAAPSAPSQTEAQSNEPAPSTSPSEQSTNDRTPSNNPGRDQAADNPSNERPGVVLDVPSPEASKPVRGNGNQTPPPTSEPAVPGREIPATEAPGIKISVPGTANGREVQDDIPRARPSTAGDTAPAPQEPVVVKQDETVTDGNDTKPRFRLVTKTSPGTGNRPSTLSAPKPIVDEIDQRRARIGGLRPADLGFTEAQRPGQTISASKVAAGKVGDTPRSLAELYKDAKKATMGISPDVQQIREAQKRDMQSQTEPFTALYERYEQGFAGQHQSVPMSHTLEANVGKIVKSFESNPQSPAAKDRLAEIIAALDYPQSFDPGQISESLVLIPRTINGKNLTDDEIKSLELYINSTIDSGSTIFSDDDKAFDPNRRATAMRALIIADLVNQRVDLIENKIALHPLPPPEAPPEVPADAAEAPQPTAEMGEADVLRKALIETGVPEEYAGLYVEYGLKHGVSPLMTSMQGKAESSFRPDVYGPWVKVNGKKTRAEGISQFLQGTFEDWKKRLEFPAEATAFMPRYAIEAQSAMMAENLKIANGDIPLALAGYNAGFGSIKEHGKDEVMNEWDETRDYIAKITGSMGEVQQIVDRINSENAAAEEARKAAEEAASRSEERKASDDSDVVWTDRVDTLRGEKLPEIWKGHIYFNQHDPRWATHIYSAGGDGGTISRSGCGATSLAMIVANLKKDPSITPDKVGDMIRGKNMKVPRNGTSHQAFTAIPNEFGLKTETIQLRKNKVQEIIDRGGYVIINGQDSDPETPATGGGHIYVIRGFTDEGKVLVLDSNSVSKTTVAYDPEDDIFKAASIAVGIWG